MEASRSERKAPFVRRMASSGQKMASAPGKKAADGPRKAFSRQQRPYFLRQMPRAPPNPTRHVRLREAEGSAHEGAQVRGRGQGRGAGRRAGAGVLSLGWHPRPAGRIRRPAESSGARTQTRDRFTHDSALPSFRWDAGNNPRDAGATGASWNPSPKSPPSSRSQTPSPASLRMW